MMVHKWPFVCRSRTQLTLETQPEQSQRGYHCQSPKTDAPDAILRYGATNFVVDVFTSYFALLRKMIRVADNVLKQAVLHPLSLCKIIEFYGRGRWCCFLSPCGRGGRDPSRLMMLPTGSYRNLINDYSVSVLHLKLAAAFVLNYAKRFLLWRSVASLGFQKRWWYSEHKILFTKLKLNTVTLLRLKIILDF